MQREGNDAKKPCREIGNNRGRLVKIIKRKSVDQ